MLCIKTTKNLSEDELKSLGELIDISYLQDYEMIVYEKIDKDIVGCITISQKKEHKLTLIDNHFVKDTHRNLGIGKKLLEMARKLTPFSLFLCITPEEDLIKYYEKQGFEVEYTENNIIMVQRK